MHLAGIHCYFQLIALYVAQVNFCLMIITNRFINKFEQDSIGRRESEGILENGNIRFAETLDAELNISFSDSMPEDLHDDVSKLLNGFSIHCNGLLVLWEANKTS